MWFVRVHRLSEGLDKAGCCDIYEGFGYPYKKVHFYSYHIGNGSESMQVIIELTM